MNLAALRTDLDRRSGVSADPIAQTQFLNDALQTICLEEKWPWLESKTTLTTVANQTDYTLPATLVTITSVQVNGDPADVISLADALNYLDNDSIAPTFGTGQFYAVRGSTLVLVPAPASAGQSIVVEYVGTEATLTLDADTPTMPARDHYIISVLACSLLLQRTTQHVGRGSTAQYSIYRKQYDEWVANQRARMVRGEGGPRIPRVRPGAAW